MVRPETSSLARWVVIAGIALIALIIIADGHEAWSDYRSVLADNERIQKALGRVLAEQTARMMQETDVVLSDYGAWAVSAEGRAADAETLRDRLHADVLRLPFVYAATLAGADGRVIATTADAARPEVLELPGAAFRDSLQIGKPSAGAGDEARTFALSRSITGADGATLRIVAARIAFEYLTGFYASVNATADTSIRLLRTDGVVLAQYPAEHSTTPHRAADDEVAIARAVEGYPVTIEVRRPRSSILRPWVHEESNSAARTLTLVVLAGVLLVALRAALLRHAAQELQRRRLERELDIAQRLDALGFLAASVAHDFNNVLTAIVGYGELTRKTLPVDSREIANIDHLLSAAERARLLVRRVLTFDPRRNVDYAPVDFAQVLVEVVEQIGASLPPTVSLSSRGLDVPVFVRGDATEMHQVVMNLCTNAVHAMPDGGRLDLELTRVELTDARALTLGRLTPGAWVCLAIADTGMGLTADQTTAIFEPFYTTRGPDQGTGIGLTVVRNVLARMQGALDVRSAVAAGTSMCVYWPSSAPGSAGTSPGAASTTSAAGRGETIMVVDDKAELVSLAEEVLASLGYEPVGFADARAALDAFRARPRRFDALITDERMEDIGGCALAQQVHEIDPRLPVILVTGYRDADTVSRAREAGVAEILDKPLNTQVLAAALSRQLAAAASGTKAPS